MIHEHTMYTSRRCVASRSMRSEATNCHYWWDDSAYCLDATSVARGSTLVLHESASGRPFCWGYIDRGWPC